MGWGIAVGGPGARHPPRTGLSISRAAPQPDAALPLTPLSYEHPDSHDIHREKFQKRPALQPHSSGN